jgi:hypothetical protein
VHFHIRSTQLLFCQVCRAGWIKSDISLSYLTVGQVEVAVLWRQYRLLLCAEKEEYYSC